MAIPPGEFNWGKENLKRAIDRGRAITVFPCPFFDTEWQADPRFKPFKNTPNSANLYEGAFAWHWHNRWDEPIQEGSKFHRLEAESTRSCEPWTCGRRRRAGEGMTDPETRPRDSSPRSAGWRGWCGPSAGPT